MPLFFIQAKDVTEPMWDFIVENTFLWLFMSQIFIRQSVDPAAKYCECDENIMQFNDVGFIEF